MASSERPDDVIALIANSQRGDTALAHMNKSKGFYGIISYSDTKYFRKITVDRPRGAELADCLTQHTGLSLLKFKLPGGNPLYKYEDDNDTENDTPPLILVMGSDHIIQSAHLVNLDWATEHVLSDVVSEVAALPPLGSPLAPLKMPDPIVHQPPPPIIPQPVAVVEEEKQSSLILGMEKL